MGSEFSLPGGFVRSDADGSGFACLLSLPVIKSIIRQSRLSRCSSGELFAARKKVYKLFKNDGRDFCYNEIEKW